jgi:hypothetical protein
MSLLNSSLSVDVQLLRYFSTVRGHLRCDLDPVIPNAPTRLLAVFSLIVSQVYDPCLFDPVCDKATTVHKVPTYVKKMCFGA